MCLHCVQWKAAKEELNDSEEEEEEEDYGILDRKRRREIEEWKSRQIASGEAKDNANFQPLGGDWLVHAKIHLSPPPLKHDLVT